MTELSSSVVLACYLVGMSTWETTLRYVRLRSDTSLISDDFFSWVVFIFFPEYMVIFGFIQSCGSLVLFILMLLVEPDPHIIPSCK